MQTDDTNLMDFTVFYITDNNDPTDPKQCKPDFSRITNKSLDISDILY